MAREKVVSSGEIAAAQKFVLWSDKIRRTPGMNVDGRVVPGRFRVGLAHAGAQAGEPGVPNTTKPSVLFTPDMPTVPHERDAVLDLDAATFKARFGTRRVWEPSSDSPNLTAMGLIEPDFDVPSAAQAYVDLPPAQRRRVESVVPQLEQPEVGVSAEEAERMRTMLLVGGEMFPGAKLVDAAKKAGWDAIRNVTSDATVEVIQGMVHPVKTAKGLIATYVDTPSFVRKPSGWFW